MNKFTYFLLSLLFFLPQGISAQEDITIIENEESQVVKGQVITISNTEEYIDTETNLYQVTGKNTILLGDVVTDGEIDVTDVVATVNMIMDDIYSNIADLNEDEELSVVDVLVEVNTIMGDVEEKRIIESYEVEDITNIWIKNGTATAVDQH